MDSDTSSYYMTTYSEDERISNALEKDLESQKHNAEAFEQERKTAYENFRHSEQELFKLPGLKFIRFDHVKIKFAFKPYEAIKSTFVSKKIVFYSSLRYRKNNWIMKRNSIPVNYKWKIYKLFYDENFFAIDDTNIISLLIKIYKKLVDWSRKEEKFRKQRYQRYLNGSDMELDADDEELFLTDKERDTLHQKKLKILKRMLPPKHKSHRAH